MTEDQFEAAHALMSWFYNLSAVAQVEFVFPGRHPNYIAEKVGLALKSPLGFFGALDDKNQRRVVADALARYSRLRL